MATEFKLPELGENIDSGRVAKILVKENERLEMDQPVIELETDKAVVEVPVRVGGTVKKILVEEGSEISVGQTILVIEDEEKKGNMTEKDEKRKKVEPEKKSEEVSTEKPPAPSKSMNDAGEKEPDVGTMKDVEFVLPELGENVQYGTVTKLLVSEGDQIQKDQNLLELETEKAVIEVPSSFGGRIKTIFVKEGDTVQVGQKILVIRRIGEEDKSQVPPEAKKIEKETTPSQLEVKATELPEEQLTDKHPIISIGAVPAAPSVRRFAREIGIDIRQVSGSGPAGRISIDDIKAFSKKLNQQRAVSTPLAPGVITEELPDFTKWGEVERQPMSKVREVTARHLSYAWATIPHVTQFDKADITELEKLRKEYGTKAEKQGGKLTITAIILKIIAGALKVFPQFNASVDMGKQEVIYKRYYNIGIAVDTNRGLLVPVVRDVDRKNIIELSVELTQIAERARNAKLSLEDMQGGNFTISNLGGIGGTAFTPVVNSPEIAILGISRSQFETVYMNEKFETKLMLPLSLSYDHRLIDGADAARFLRWICEVIEQPFKFILEG
jgi:pyruvate dehydrogenase E2 component (dihydrolipoamide acetyltransferase)